MKTFATLISLTALAHQASSATVSVSFDQTYDNGPQSLDTVSCSNGPNGLESKGFTTFNSLPNFPFIGGAAVVEGFNSVNCGTCWTLTFQGRSINVTAIDHAGTGFNIALTAVNVLTNNQAEFLGRVNADAKPATPASCGFSSRLES